MNPGTPSSQATASNNVLVEGWPAQQRELGLEIERLSMWKYDVRDQGIDIKFEDENNPLHTIIRRCLVNIAHVLIGCEYTSAILGLWLQMQGHLKWNIENLAALLKHVHCIIY